MELIIINILNILFWILGIYLLINCLYLAFFAIAGLFSLPKSQKHASEYKKIALLFPTYRENSVIIESVKSALKHQYNGLFEVVVISDGLLPQTNAILKEMGANVIEVFFEKSTKGKALRFAMEKLKHNGFDIAMVLDVDNVLGSDCLHYINNSFQQGNKVIQVHRTAKDVDTSFAFLDACNEEVNNQIYRKGHAVVGLSATLIGSGMAFDFSYFHKVLDGVGETVGEDKKIDFILANDKIKVAYLNDVFVYDEKVENAQVFTNQRTRWIASQIEFLKEYALEGLVKLFKGNIEFFNKTFQTFLVPRILLLALLFIMAVQSFFNPIGPGSVFWNSLFLSLCFTLLIAVPRRFYVDKRLYLAILQIPRAMIGMVIALFSIGKAKKSFMVTPHHHKPVNDNN
ncbi:cellulose synthase/poly-beta-1,6-N-acetylglucosamine synthase-like glycosyltransferase [Pedobacter psychrotolerans]|uniref:Cellulose synthase/poly-beta-1,6-N-acetylglucosamine synthase-like glycosyltransferase n=1 Tax=Pedobacter psychrotolerans TaxID=1843235 RepID=A0A4R2H4Y7_9SPHI|nr:glycosyltransferase [Pedobacter psychrotolerans]TCO20692.1 cellulose synthase/poly-beta-1,6-N-acetylglucosamine synthase-like glycosyltransferase [Pedobacter psychrotolerans]GGE67358.1 glycosyl transferase [Pedobacter psychrotolerans]